MKYRATSQEYVRTFGRLGRAVIARGGFVSFELPRHCEGWKEQTVQAMLEDLKLDPVDVDSSALGLQSKTSEPILKPWRIAVSSPLTRKALDGLRCQRGHTHVSCTGNETARSAFYPAHLCNAIHDGLDAHESASADKCVSDGCVATLVIRSEPFSSQLGCGQGQSGDVHGSALGLQSKTSEPILKPWRIAVSSPLTRKALDGLRCQGGHTVVQCSWDETARSAFCPEHLCNAIHDGVDAHESASADKDVGGSALRLLGETLLIPMLSARFIPLLSAHNIPSKMRSVSGIVFSMKRREALLLPSVRLLKPRKTLRGSSAASSIICTSRRRMTRSQS